MSKNHEIVQRDYDKKWVVWSSVDHPSADLDYHRRSGTPVPQVWVPIAVETTRELADQASKRSRI